MRCPSCGFENLEGMKFCGKCASPLSSRCPQCGFENPPGYVFCGQCATPLTGQTLAPSPTQAGHLRLCFGGQVLPWAADQTGQ